MGFGREETHNRIDWTHGQKAVTAAGTAEQLPSQAIPDGFELVIRGLPGNTGNIFLGKTKALAESATDRLQFTAGNGITLKVRNADKVWVDAAVSDEGVDYWTEA